MATFDAASFFADQGLKLAGVDKDSGLPMLSDGTDAPPKKFDLPQFLRDQGADPAKTDYSLNNPEEALSDSPITFGDRFKLAFAPEKDRLAFLNKNYGETTYDDHKGLVVKHQGAWQEVDPNFFGEADLGKIVAGMQKATRPLAVGYGYRPSAEQGFGGMAMDAIRGVGEVASESFKAVKGAAHSIASGSAAADLAGDVADLPADALKAALQTFGAASGGAAGAGVAGAAGSLATAAIGKKLGVNTQTMSEMAGDAFLEGTLGYGAQFLAAAARPEVEGMLKAIGVGEAKGPQGLINGIKEFSSKASESVKNKYAYLTSFLTKRDPEAVAALIDHSEPVVKAIGEHLKIAGTDFKAVGNAISAANKEKRAVFGQLLDEASDAHSAQWVRNQSALASSAGAKAVKVAPDQLNEGLAKVLESSGLGRVSSESTNTVAKTAASKETANLTQALSGIKAEQAAVGKQIADLNSKNTLSGVVEDKVLKPLQAKLEKLAANEATVKASLADAQMGAKAGIKKQLKFIPFEGAAADARTGAGKPLTKLDESFHSTIQEMVSSVERLAQKGSVNGAEAANQLVGYRKRLSALAKSIAEEGGPGGWHTPKGAAAAKLLDGIDDLFTKLAQKAGLGEQWAKLIEDNAASATAVKQMRVAMADPEKKSIETLLNRLLSKPGKNEAQKDLYNTVVKLLGPKADHLVQKIRIQHAAENFLQIQPHFGWIQAMGTTGMALGGMHNPVALTAGAAMVGMSSPRIAAGTAAAAASAKRSMAMRSAKVFQLMERMNPVARAHFLRNPTVIDGITRSVIESAAHEAKLIDSAHQAVEQAMQAGSQQKAQQ